MNWARMDHHDMPNIYRRSLIVCLPSYREGIPKSLMEAASSQRPFVALDLTGCREIVLHDETAILAPFGNVESLKAALLHLLSDRQKCAELGKAGRKLVMKEFSSTVINRRTFEIWEELM